VKLSNNMVASALFERNQRGNRGDSRSSFSPLVETMHDSTRW
jgi:hypothetical protein